MLDALSGRLHEFGQDHLIEDIKKFSEEQKRRCYEQLFCWNDEKLDQQRQSWVQRSCKTDLQSHELEPLWECPVVQKEMVQMEAPVGVLILAGGQGSRLGTEKPKGCFPLLGKSLFEWHCQKLAAKKVPVAIFTSSLNHEETVSFFQSHQFFGLEHVHFCSQETLPLFDREGRWFWQAPGRIAEGADGNGSVFRVFAQSGILQTFMQMGVQVIHIVPVDNPLADPLDFAFLNYHQTQQADLSIKVIRLAQAQEAMGRLMGSKDRLKIIEFAELTEQQRHQSIYANTGLLAINCSLVERLAECEFPLHWAWRLASYWDGCQTIRQHAWKAESFIVDALPFAKRVQPVCYSREVCYAPLKEKSDISQLERLLIR